jgi:CBS-domain-containing membrane protein
VQAVSVDLERSEDKSFSWSLMIIGLSLSGFGFAVYYVVPLSLLTMDLTLLLNIFFFILIGTIHFPSCAVCAACCVCAVAFS